MRISDREQSRRNPVLLAALLVASLVVITAYYREGDAGLLHRARSATLAATAPLSRVGEATSRPFRAVGEWFSGLTVSRKELERLKEQNDVLRARLADLEEARQENDRLRQLVAFAEEQRLTQLGARVIGRPTSSWEGAIVVDRGSVDGIRPGMPVIAPQGLVGQIETVSKHASRVRLITDAQSGVAAMIQRTRAVGVVRGSIDRTLTMEYVDKAKMPKVGDVVITSGLGGVYPKGIVVGDVIQVDARRADLYPRIVLRSRVPIDELEEVLIVLGTVPADAGGSVE
ncbi:rod shape-determining protein MreC [Coriobacteriia bacterium Es71-Z0120]|uniref:rod shape-determining protein MreC n=1 Tax=Parvivirga hydrogeniphila TaxID=2939460 RepID=UPI002260F533|nr:rod shape-determining protein MreC [Parvivirga hydrogeniphila]MCL4078962.1 rod shape-determining protein MreC [Parvivirga hydrogeniphila]